MMLERLKRWLRTCGFSSPGESTSQDLGPRPSPTKPPSRHPAEFQIDAGGAAIDAEANGLPLDPTSAEELGRGPAVFQFDAACGAADLAPGLSLTDPAVHFNHGNALADEGELEQAVAEYSLAIECDDLAGLSDAQQRCLLGYLASPFDPRDQVYTSPKAYLNRGLVLESLGRYSQAIADYSQVVALCPEFPHAYLARGGARLALAVQQRDSGDLNQAQELLTQAVQDALQVAEDRDRPADAAAVAAELLVRLRSELLTLRRLLEDPA